MNAAMPNDLAHRYLSAVPRQLLIGGQWVDAKDGATFPTENPATKATLARVASAGKADVDDAVKLARAAFDSWSKVLPGERRRILLKIADLLDDHCEHFAHLETLDNGMPISIARIMCNADTSDVFRYFAGWCDKLEGITTATSLPNVHGFTIREPLGVCALITPWNAPLKMAVWKLAPCLATGNVAILKPAEETPLSTLLFGKILQEAGVPDGVVSILTGPGEITGAALTAHPDVDKVSFTGSVETGKAIVRAAADNLKKVTLELGGKSPNIVFPDANLEAAIPGSAMAIFLNSGQICTAGSRMYVHRSVFEQVVDGMIKAANAIKIGAGFEPGSQMGPVVSSTQFSRVRSLIESGVEEGAKVVAGAGTARTDGYYVNPTVLVDVRPEMRVVREEIFGPVVVAAPFEDTDDLIRQSNHTPFGLAASLWTQNFSRAHSMARALKVGTVWINTWGVLDNHLPFGGYKQSGWGREFGSEALETYTQVKSVIAQL